MPGRYMTKKEYLEELAEKAAKVIAQSTTPHTIELMVPLWKDIIIKEVSPILELIK